MRDRMRRINPEALWIMDMIEEDFRKAGGRGVCVDLTGDMTSEEQEMALFARFLKEGYDPETAPLKAKQWRELIEKRTSPDMASILTKTR